MSSKRTLHNYKTGTESGGGADLRKSAQVVNPKTKSAGMSLYSQGMDRIDVRIGFPRWRGETSIVDPLGFFEGKACGVGCTIFGPFDPAGGGLSSR